MIPGRHADHTAPSLLRRQRPHPVERTARLERAGALEQLGLEMPARPETARAERRRPERRTPDRRRRTRDVAGCDRGAGHAVILVDRPEQEECAHGRATAAADPRRRHGRSRAVTGDGLLPTLPRDPAPVRGRCCSGSPRSPSTVILWIALVFEGKAPRTLQEFVASYLRYATQVSAYVFLAAAPYPRFGGAAGYPIDLEIDLAPRQGRGDASRRLVLAFPAFLLIAVLGGGMSGGSSANVPSWTASGSDEWWLSAWSVGGVSTTVAVPRVVRDPRSRPDAARSARPARVLRSATPRRRRATSSCSPTLPDVRPDARRALLGTAGASRATRS